MNPSGRETTHIEETQLEETRMKNKKPRRVSNGTELVQLLNQMQRAQLEQQEKLRQQLKKMCEDKMQQLGNFLEVLKK